MDGADVGTNVPEFVKIGKKGQSAAPDTRKPAPERGPRKESNTRLRLVQEGKSAHRGCQALHSRAPPPTTPDPCRGTGGGVGCAGDEAGRRLPGRAAGAAYAAARCARQLATAPVAAAAAHLPADLQVRADVGGADRVPRLLRRQGHLRQPLGRHGQLRPLLRVAAVLDGAQEHPRAVRLSDRRLVSDPDHPRPGAQQRRAPPLQEDGAVDHLRPALHLHGGDGGHDHALPGAAPPGWSTALWRGWGWSGSRS